eukprot:CAMPEP_0205805550 /NCGR_PEP_ID=MMETSP0205-20121125/8816_1 /ASSEMBLY_ACC=CAM_ASM_000278 /TAXON_ID=36767 /ORGANISM="Euplotes focardii, Strain TN1" /LENGTH=122 /DNA_ID=CAMNT_0053076965 /DNA_START=889 /DNA_END=1254 /DNA_ORIENTATION=-
MTPIAKFRYEMKKKLVPSPSTRTNLLKSHDSVKRKKIEDKEKPISPQHILRKHQRNILNQFKDIKGQKKAQARIQLKDKKLQNNQTYFNRIMKFNVSKEISKVNDKHNQDALQLAKNKRDLK